MDPDTDNMFAGLKKKKKKTVQILETNDDDGAAISAKAAAEDPVRPTEKSADLTLPDEEPLDFSDLKKV
jgi:predicted RNA-binding protein with RPS1 domain